MLDLFFKPYIQTIICGLKVGFSLFLNNSALCLCDMEGCFFIKYVVLFLKTKTHENHPEPY
jgi:hypothetical protein